MDNQLQKGIQLLQEGDLDAAQEIFEKSLERKPNDAASHLWLGNCFVLQGELGKARTEFRAVMKHGGEELQAEARRQLYSLWYNRLVYHLILQPPLRYLLLLAVTGYVASLALLPFPQHKDTAEYIFVASIWIVLPLFFAWITFIVTYFVGSIAFAPDSSGPGVKSARLAIALAGIFVIPANLFINMAVGVKILAVFLDVFLLSLMASQLISRLGKKLAGEESMLILHQLARASSIAKNHVEPPKPEQGSA